MEAQIERGQLHAITRLYDAALKGDVPSLLNLLGEDPLILDRCIIGKSGSFMQSPLHVAVNFGHVNFTEEIIKQKPEIVELVDQIKRSSPLHIASTKGNLLIVEVLLAVNPSICYTHDQDGKTPVHVAAINGQIEVLRILLKMEPQAAWERTIGGETVLHLCVKHKQPKALKFLIEMMDDNELLNFDDSLGFTVLQLAVAAKQSEMVEFLLEHPKIKKNAISKKGLSAVDIHKRSRKDVIQDEKIWKHLNRANALPAKEALKPKKDRAWLEDQRTSLMVVASLIATMAFQAGINPPGGVWQDDLPYSGTIDKMTRMYIGHDAGTAIWSYSKDTAYSFALISNTIGLISSLSVILLLISGLPCKRYFLTFLRIILWISVTATAFTYMFSVSNLTHEDSGIWAAITISLLAWLGLMGFILFGHVVRFIWKKISWRKRQSIIKFCKRCYPW
ncbi:ankyrin repeat-containing protein At2g01680-like [Chenopodium quinoa]|uniref:ankyrin repeat-containing protein At2g01680-like n=1 Tax=Chenopodium quinoa TaxID=63459 RepID=UPI000B7718D4|nr:ankyrin repeat-containing protein At2g01680-like [Chenopodium quinoa]